MKGWVYIISNKAMPGLVKVGYSTKDPELRAEELNHTGSPCPYIVDYDLLIDDPYQIEQKTHKLLASMREGKEWFRCSAEVAIAAIKQVTNDQAIAETYKLDVRKQAEAIRHQQQDVDKKLQAEKDSRALENARVQKEEVINRFYQQRLTKEFSAPPFWSCWVSAFSIIYVFGLSGGFSSDLMEIIFLSIIVGFFIGGFFYFIILNHKKSSDKYLAIKKQWDDEINALRSSSMKK